MVWLSSQCVVSVAKISEKERQTHRERDRQTQRQTNIQTDRQTDRQTGRQADRQINQIRPDQTDKTARACSI